VSRIGFVSTRFAGLDGVSLEAAKLGRVAAEAGHEVVWFAGELGSEFRPGRLEPAAHFESPANRALQARCFGTDQADPEVDAIIRRRADLLRTALGEFVDEFGVDTLVLQNSSTIPMQIPLGVATAELIATRRMRAVAHHHDFWWERPRFSPTTVPGVLDAAFPPDLPTIDHMVINSIARSELEQRGIASTLLPNVMDFENPPASGDRGRFRSDVGAGPDEVIVLQPTRMIPRKAIQDTIDLAAMLPLPAVVVITHPEHDEGGIYPQRLERHAADREVRLVMLAVDEPDGPTLADAYAGADIVSFPSRIEGFGNALLETCYYRRPLLVRRYPVYVADIATAGISAVEIDDGITPGTVNQVERLLGDTDAAGRMVDTNYEVCIEHFSYRVLRDRFLPLLEA
jgi:glycosyltransferase involved in cell wall biosynthesis